MSRTILDEDLMEWEVYAETGPFGYPDASHVVFHCTTDLARRARYVEIEGDKAEAERIVAETPTPVLTRMLGEAVEMD